MHRNFFGAILPELNHAFSSMRYASGVASILLSVGILCLLPTGMSTIGFQFSSPSRGMGGVVPIVFPLTSATLFCAAAIVYITTTNQIFAELQRFFRTLGHRVRSALVPFLPFLHILARFSTRKHVILAPAVIFKKIFRELRCQVLCSFVCRIGISYRQPSRGSVAKLSIISVNPHCSLWCVCLASALHYLVALVLFLDRPLYYCKRAAHLSSRVL